MSKDKCIERIYKISGIITSICLMLITYGIYTLNSFTYNYSMRPYVGIEEMIPRYNRMLWIEGLRRA